MLPSLRAWWAVREHKLLTLALVTGLVSHGYGLLRYPLFLTDEGIYVQRAWSTLEQGQLSPYTYFYDHAPGGWLLLAVWNAVLPGGFDAFGNPIATGRVLMLVLHLASVWLLFGLARQWSRGLVAPTVATLLFNLSPLAVFYQRMVLLDNIMVFWLLLSLYLVERASVRILAAAAAGAAFGAALVTKENALFFAPALGFLLLREVRAARNRRFSTAFYVFTGLAPAGAYVMYAALKGELLPSGLDFNTQSPQDHVSLASTVWWQVHRTQGSPVGGDSLFVQMTRDFWMPKDSLLLAFGALATVLLLVVGLRVRRRDPAPLVAALLCLGYAAYLVRGSVLLEFYIVPLIPFLALNVGLVAGRLLASVPGGVAALAVTAMSAVLALPTGGYLLTHGDTGRLQAPDMYRLDLTRLQADQLDWVRAHVPPGSRMIIDDDMWPALHSDQPPYRDAVSHWEAAADPAVRDKLFPRGWRDIDYIVSSNKMRRSMVLNNTDGRETWILRALDQHSQRVWHIKRGNVELSVDRVPH